MLGLLIYLEKQTGFQAHNASSGPGLCYILPVRIQGWDPRANTIFFFLQVRGTVYSTHMWKHHSESLKTCVQEEHTALSWSVDGDLILLWQIVLFGLDDALWL